MNDLSIPKLKTVADYEYVLVDNAQLYIYTSASKSDYCSYLTRLSDFGAKNIFSNQIGNNLFNTYIYGDRLIHAYYYEGSDEVRVVLEKKCGKLKKSIFHRVFLLPKRQLCLHHGGYLAGEHLVALGCEMSAVGGVFGIDLAGLEI